VAEKNQTEPKYIFSSRTLNSNACLNAAGLDFVESYRTEEAGVKTDKLISVQEGI